MFTKETTHSPCQRLQSSTSKPMWLLLQWWPPVFIAKYGFVLPSGGIPSRSLYLPVRRLSASGLVMLPITLLHYQCRCQPKPVPLFQLLSDGGLDLQTAPADVPAFGEPAPEHRTEGATFPAQPANQAIHSRNVKRISSITQLDISPLPRQAWVKHRRRSTVCRRHVWQLR